MNEVIIEKYNSNWPLFFKIESEKIEEVLFSHGDKKNAIHHIGSTSIPGMPAKPVIDIMIEFDCIFEIEDIKRKLAHLNYIEFSRHVIPHYSYFSRKKEGDISYHLHLRERGDPQIKRHIHFRDYLIAHKDDANEYAKIKINLAKKFNNDRYQYTLGKDDFIQYIDRKAKIWESRRKHFLKPNTNLSSSSSKERILNAIEANIIVHMTHLEQYLGTVNLKRQPKYTRVLNSNLPCDSFNYILETEFQENQAKEIIEEAIKPFCEKDIPYSWWVFPNDKPKNIMDCLKQNGFTQVTTNRGMYFDLENWNKEATFPEDFNIKKASDGQTLNDFAFVLANENDAFDSHFHEISKILTDDDCQEFYVGYLNDKPISCGLICFFGRVAGLHCLTTSLNYRNKGYGTAMQMFRLKRAKELGYKTAILQASSSGYSLYSKLGWKTLGEFHEFKSLL